MLERERNDILDSLKGRRTMRARKPLRYHGSDSTMKFSCIPMHLFQYLLVECWKSEIVLVTILVDICEHVRNPGYLHRDNNWDWDMHT